MSVNIDIKNYERLKKNLNKIKEAPEKVMKIVTAEAKKRVPGWIAAEVCKAYGVKKGEVTGNKLGTVKAEGKNIQNVKIVYNGRMLTPTHFSLSPKVPKVGGSYMLKATIIKGKRTTLGKVKKMSAKQKKAVGLNFTRSGTKNSTHSPIMLMRANGGHYLPFQRKSTNRKNIEAIKVISLPQMVSSERTEKGIKESLNDNLGKRLEHYLNRYMPDG